ncbi:hypothetical protein Hypma_010764 [Hypsizygus marmoreus]|uniref:Uncharacterized protein n=1 Tax=Hypsizygus marmoreus TaxID=39966 RepID=A0A369JRA1_HYPMA|nr:hypothetical protein Hypma_010764 [Hypsizygus marmoreus]
MSQTTAYQGAVTLLDRISLEAIIPQHNCSVSQENPSFVTSYDLGPNCMVVPGENSHPHLALDSRCSPPLWSPPELPIDLPIDTLQSTHEPYSVHAH